MLHYWPEILAVSISWPVVGAVAIAKMWVG